MRVYAGLRSTLRVHECYVYMNGMRPVKYAYLLYGSSHAPLLVPWLATWRNRRDSRHSRLGAAARPPQHRRSRKRRPSSNHWRRGVVSSDGNRPSIFTASRLKPPPPWANGCTRRSRHSLRPSSAHFSRSFCASVVDSLRTCPILYTRTTSLAYELR